MWVQVYLKPHKTHPTAYLVQTTNHHGTQQIICHNTNTLWWLIFYSAENHMQQDTT